MGRPENQYLSVGFSSCEQSKLKTVAFIAIYLTFGQLLEPATVVSRANLK